MFVFCTTVFPDSAEACRPAHQLPLWAGLVTCSVLKMLIVTVSVPFALSSLNLPLLLSFALYNTVFSL